VVATVVVALAAVVVPTSSDPVAHAPAIRSSASGGNGDSSHLLGRVCSRYQDSRFQKLAAPSNMFLQP